MAEKIGRQYGIGDWMAIYHRYGVIWFRGFYSNIT
jgi:hypothetical protein